MSAHAWIEVNLGAIQNNFRQIHTLTGPDVVTMAVIKANAYGHGLTDVTRALQDAGASWLAVSHVQEGLDARSAGFGGQILLLCPPRGSDCEIAVAQALSICIMDADGIEETVRFADSIGITAGVHLKVDTGLGRLGVRPELAPELAKRIGRYESLRLDGVYSHCAEGCNEAAVIRQLRIFEQCCAEIERAGIAIPLRHIAASAAMLSTSQSHLDAVRIGTLLYGQYPNPSLSSTAVGRALKIENTWTFKTRVIAIRSLPPGASIGYGSQFQTGRISKVATIPVGLADGFGLQPSSMTRNGMKAAAKALFPSRFPLWVEIRNRNAPVLGRVAMNLCSIDITDITEVRIGDEVILPVRRLSANAAIPRRYVLD